MWSPVRTRALLLAGIAGLVATSCMAGTASARPGHIYWGSQGNGSSIGRMDLDGGNPDPTWATGLTCTCLVEFGNGGIWWAAGGTIRRADTTTGEVTTPLPQATATSVNIAAGGILTYSPSTTNVGWYSYDTAGGPVAGPLWAGGLSAYTRVGDWAYAMRFTTNPLRFRIVRVRADGSGVEEPLTEPMARDGGYAPQIHVHGDYVYFGYSPTSSTSYIGRARTDGGGSDPAWVALESGADAPWVAATSTHLYWLSAYTSGDARRKILRLPLDGTGTPTVIREFLPPAGTTIASMTVDPGAPDEPVPTPAVSAATPSATPATPAALEASVMPSRRRAVSGQQVRIGIRVRNTGGSPAQAVSSCLRLPSNMVVMRRPSSSVRSGRTICFRKAIIGANSQQTAVITVRAVAVRAVSRTVVGVARATGVARASAQSPHVVIRPRTPRARVTG